ncbi:MAG: Antitermination regulatory protein [Microbacteriaceae bacterium]|jgi:hypothetical protein|nr:Antitermination regulatory protein [Microbacteriaceae bacterium]
MPRRQALDKARRDLTFAHDRGTSLCQPFLAVLPVRGAAVSLLRATSQSTVCSSDTTAARLDELQFDLGEGPCWDALSTRRPILRPLLTTSSTGEWPLFINAVREDHLACGIAGIYAFPLFVGTLDLGAVDLYTTNSRPLEDDQVADATELAAIASWQVLRGVLTDRVVDDAEGPTTHNRREVHQATGMVLAQLEITADEASLLLRAHAFASGRTVAEVARDVIERRLNFADGTGDAE